MLNGDCNTCINDKLPSYSETCVECGLSRKNYKPITNYDRIRAMTDEELAHFIAVHLGLAETGGNRWLTTNEPTISGVKLNWHIAMPKPPIRLDGTQKPHGGKSVAVS